MKILTVILCLLNTITALNVEFTEYEPSRYPQPEFLPSQTQVEAYTGDVVALYCSVRNLGTKTVIWRRASEPTPLTIGELVYVDDPNIMVNHVRRTGQWNLLIKKVTPEYEGAYECQVSTKTRKIRKLFTLKVTDRPTPKPPDINIFGKEFVERDSTLRLICNASGGEYSPEEIDWFKDGNILFGDADRGVTIAKRMSLSDRTIGSVYEVKRASVHDAGTYVCRTSDRQITSLKVNVLNAETSNRKRDAAKIYTKRLPKSSSATSPKIGYTSMTSIILVISMGVHSFLWPR